MASGLLRTAVLMGVAGGLCWSAFAQDEAPRIDGKKIVMIVGSSKWRDEELYVPRAIFESKGAEVKLASSSREPSKGMLGGVVTPDLTLSEVRVDDLDALVLVGGVGAKEYWSSPDAHRLAREASEKGKVVAAICVAPVILARAGLLSQRRATVWASEKGELEKAGARYTGKPVEVDGNLVTADGPESAAAFAEAVLRKLAPATP